MRIPHPNKFPGVGMRNIKTAIAASLCALVYYYIGRSPAFACIGAIFGMGSDMEDARRNGGNRLFGQKAQRVHYIAAETFFAPHRRSFPRRKFIVPTFHRDSGKQKRMRRTLCNGGNFVVHMLQFMLVRHLKQKIFGAVCAVNAAGSISDPNLLCGHGNCLLKNF